MIELIESIVILWIIIHGFRKWFKLVKEKAELAEKMPHAADESSEEEEELSYAAKTSAWMLLDN